MPEKYVLSVPRGGRVVKGEGGLGVAAELVLEFERGDWNFACAKLLRSFKEECFMV